MMHRKNSITFLLFVICVLEFKKNNYICTHIFAGMVKLVDMPDLGSGAARRVGSSPITRTESSDESLGFFCGIMRKNYFQKIFSVCYKAKKPSTIKWKAFHWSNY